MKRLFLSAIKSRHQTKKQGSMVTILARKRMSRTMPGEAGALASLRYGGISV